MGNSGKINFLNKVNVVKLFSKFNIFNLTFLSQFQPDSELPGFSKTHFSGS